jgi:hypothetical protein
MKLGSKKTKQAELLDVLGGDVSTPTGPSDTPASVTANAPEPAPVLQKVTGRGSLPEVEEMGYVDLFLPLFLVILTNI